MIRKSLLFLLLPLFLLTSCAALFQPKVAMGNSTSNGSLSDLLAEEEEITTLPPSAQILASEGLYSDRIQVTWQPVAHAVSYSLERAVQTPEDPGYATNTPPDTFEVINSSVYGTSYTDIILDNPGTNNKEYANKYWYRVYAENNRLKYDPSAPTTTTVPATLFAPPQNVSAETGVDHNYIKVSWVSAKSASSYIVYRTVNSNGTGAEEIARVTGDRTEYRNEVAKSEQGKDFYFIIKALNSKSGQLSASSNIALGYSAVEGAPPAPGAVQVTTRGTAIDGITFKWNEVTSPDGTVNYALFRYSSEDAALTQLTGETTKTTWTDKNNVKPGIYYYYQVQAWIEDKQTGQKLKSSLSKAGEDIPSTQGFLLSAPSGISVDADSSGHTITWSPAIGSEEEQKQYTYEILGSDDKASGFASIGTTSAGETKYTISAGSTKKFYRVKTAYSGISSKESETVAPSPFAAKNLTVSRAANLGAVYQANSSGVYPVELKWAAPEGGATAYHIYRSTSQDSGFRKITESPVTECAYIDQNDTAKAGKYYYYRVLAVNELEQGKNYSDTIHGYGALTHEQYILEFNKTIKSSQKKMDFFNRPGSTDKLGTETINGNISGTVLYSAKIAGLGANIVIRYDNYADSYIDGNSKLGVYFNLTGNSDTSASMDQSGSMSGTITCTGMYPGSVSYDKIQIKGGNAGGGTYGVQPKGFERKELDYRILN